MDAIPTTQDDRRRWLIDSLLAELASDERIEVPRRAMGSARFSGRSSTSGHQRL